jgi:twitching motility protein PilT
MNIVELIRLAKSMGASDMHLSVSSPPMFRINGNLQIVEHLPTLAAEDMETTFNDLTNAWEKEEFQKARELDFGYTVQGLVRVRCNAALQKGTISMVMRLIPTSIPNIDTLSIPDICKELILKPRGMLIISGPTGSGKSTTLASMIDYMNHRESRRIVTVEDPIEYVYTNDKCNITQRELGSDTHSFADALRHILRQDPDIILVGEMRDPETAAAALIIAETGHLVLTTGHAPSTYQAVERMIDLFPPHERPLAQNRIASLLIGILCQALVPKTDGKGRVPAIEIMLANGAVRNLIREGKIHQLPNTILTNSRMGMQLLDQSLVTLFRERKITAENVFAFCNDKEEVEKIIGNAERRLVAV